MFNMNRIINKFHANTRIGKLMCAFSKQNEYIFYTTEMKTK